MSDEFKTLLTLLDGPLLEVILNRPDTHNSVNHAMHGEMIEVFQHVRRMPDVRAIVLGATGKSFSAGGSFDQILEDRTQPALLRKLEIEGRELLMSIGNCPVPIVTAVQGDAVGLGATLLLATDAVVAFRDARIADPHVVVGLAAGDGGCVVWPLNTSFLRAKRYLLTGDRIRAEDALAMGLVTDLVDTPEAALPAARELARRIAALPPLAIRGTKRIFNQIFRERMDAIFEFGLAVEMQTFASQDLAEAISGFRERRQAKFTGN
jgi:enoyl-CoA hydratase